MFRKSLVLTAVVLSSTVLAELPRSLTKAQILSIINGASTMQDPTNRSNWTLDRNNLIERPFGREGGVIVSMDSVLALIHADIELSIMRGIYDANTARYLVSGYQGHDLHVYTLHFTRN